MFKLSSIYKSLIRHVVDAKDSIIGDGISPEMEYFSWDTRDEESELDEIDLIGIAGWSFLENGGLWEVMTGIVVSTVNDENLTREMEIIDRLHDFFGEGESVPLRDPETGDVYTNLVVTEFELQPAGRSEKRNYRTVGLQLLRTENDA